MNEGILAQSTKGSLVGSLHAHRVVARHPF